MGRGPLMGNLWRALFSMALCGVGLSTAHFSTAQAQFFPAANQFDLSDSVDLDTAASATRTRLNQVRAYLDGSRWNEAVEALVQIIDNEGEKLIKVARGRYINVRDYCHLEIAKLPPEALEIYRRRVDPQAAQWYRQAVRDRSSKPFRNIVTYLYGSSWGDEAIDMLAELALEEADHGRARALWEMLVPPPDPNPASPRLYYPRLGRTAAQLGEDEQHLADIPLADVRARLVLVSILEGATQRATDELARYRELHPEAAGRLRGRSGPYADTLSALVERSHSWRPYTASTDWTTFAGSGQRSKVLPNDIDPVARPLWRIKLPPAPRADSSAYRNVLHLQLGVAEDMQRPLSYHPIVVGDVMFVNTLNRILAYRLADGKEAWPLAGGASNDVASHRRRASLGIPRFTMTAHGGKVFARQGNPVTKSNADGRLLVDDRGSLVALDMEQEGKLLWKIVPEKGWAFDGVPVCDGRNVYIAMRRSEVRSQAHVASFDAANGKRRWRRRVTSAETPAGDHYDEQTHSLLTLHRDTLYFNTNLGVVASLSTASGDINWATLYPRASVGDFGKSSKHFYRDLNPCIYHRGRLLAAPADCESIFALNAETGEFLWKTNHQLDDVVHLIGVSGRYLLASGHRLYWIDLERDGRVSHWHPDGSDKLGYGRGVLAGDSVYWPTRESIKIFPQQPASDQPYVQQIGEVRLNGSETAIESGNLLVAGDLLLISSNAEIVALSPRHIDHERLKGEVTAHPDRALPRLELARCEESLRNWQMAIDGYQQAAALAGDSDYYEGRPIATVAREELHRLLLRRSRQLAAERNWAAAVARLNLAVKTAPTPRAGVEAALAAAKLCTTAKRPALACAQYQLLLADVRLAAVPVDAERRLQVPARRLAARHIAQLVRQHGDEVYAEIEAEAKAKLVAAAANDDWEAVRLLCRRYPNAAEVAKVLPQVGKQLLEAGRTAAAGECFRQRLEIADLRLVPDASNSDLSARIRSWFQLARCYEQLGRQAAARQAWVQLAEIAKDRQPAKIQLPWEQLSEHGSLPATSNIAKLAQARSRLPALVSPRSRSVRLALPLETAPRMSAGRVHAHFDAQGFAAASYLVEHDANASLVERDSGREIARLALRGSPDSARGAAILWADQFGSRLLIASGTSLSGFELAGIANDPKQHDAGNQDEARDAARGGDDPSNAQPTQPLDPKWTVTADDLRNLGEPVEGRARDQTARSREPRFEQFCRAGGRIVARFGTTQLAAFDPASGKIVWRYTPQAGRLHEHLHVVGNRIVAQVRRFAAETTDEIDELIALDVDDGRETFRHQTSGGRWPRPPVTLDNRTVVIVDADESVRLVDLEAGEELWRLRHSEDPGYREPDVLVWGDLVAVFWDGQELMLFDAYRGRALWAEAAAVGPQPLSQPRIMAAADDRAIYCTALHADGMHLKAFSLVDGQTLWKQKRYLGERNAGWQVARLGSYVMSHPRRFGEKEKFRVVLVDPASGDLAYESRELVAAAGESRVGLLANGLMVAASECVWLLDGTGRREEKPAAIRGPEPTRNSKPPAPTGSGEDDPDASAPRGAAVDGSQVGPKNP